MILPTAWIRCHPIRFTGSMWMAEKSTSWNTRLRQRRLMTETPER
nr:MAG TPA: hypothetical protein [Caudoviricetes sp.]